MSAVLPTQTDEIISYNPATGEEVGRVPVMSADEVKAVVERFSFDYVINICGYKNQHTQNI